LDFTYGPEERAFRAQVRSFLRENHDPEVMDPTREGMAQLVDTPKRRQFMKKLSERGWIGMSWPKEYGGQDAPGIYEYILNEELATVGAPLIGKGVGIVGKTIMRHGNETLKKEFLPKILHAEIEFAIGYSEPNAGSDLAALSLRCTKTDGGWLLNGQKRFTTSAHFADWYWVAGRTDPDAPKHKGISLFLVPMDAKGIEVVNMPCLAGERTNEVFLDDVFVPDDYVVGDLNESNVWVMPTAMITLIDCDSMQVPDRDLPGRVFRNAVGKPEFIRAEWLKPGCVVVDAGYHPELVGDVDLDGARRVASAVTPVPGGVGPMTIAILLEQTVDAAYRQAGLS
jgi:alkylation response protein AidB-like acyl-CoA dehydrogenase